MKNLNINKLIAKFHLDYFRVIHSLKTACACLLGMAIVHILRLPNGQWIPITVMVVMSAQPHFGAALSKAYMRFLGTIAGVTITLTTLLLFGNESAVIFFAVFIATTFFTYIACGGGDISYAGTLGGVTVILTLTGLQTSTQFALQRSAYIISGILLALLVSRFIHPIHARDILRGNIANSLRNLSKLYMRVFEPAATTEDNAIIDAPIEEALAKTLAEQPMLIHEAVIGSKLFAQKKTIFNDMVSAEHRIRRLIVLMHRSLVESGSRDTIQQQLVDVNSIHPTITATLNDLANCMEMRVAPNNFVNLHHALETIELAVTKLPKEEQAEKLIVEHSLLFFLQQLIKEVSELQVLVGSANCGI